MALCKRLALFAALVFYTGIPLWADKIVMNDGKIYEGRIMGQSTRSVLIRLAHHDGNPIFLNLQDVQTVIHDPQGPEAISSEAHRFAVLDVLVTGNLFSSRTLDFKGAPGLTFEGGFRLHPALELGAGIDLLPHLSGNVSVGDSARQTIRGYDSFYAYSGGFHMKLFPFFKKSQNRFEPYIMGGYHWNRLTPKASGDYFSGTSWLTGVGSRWRWTPALSLEARVLYQRVTFDSVKFQSDTGDLSGIHQNNVSIGTGVAFRFL